MNNIHPSTWTSQQVEEWLIRNQFHDSVQILCQEYQIDGQHLLNLEKSEVLHLTNNQNLYYQIENLKQTSLSKMSRAVPPITSVPRSSQPAQSMAILLEPPTSIDQIEDQPESTCCLFVSIRSDKKKTFFAFLLAMSTVFFCSFIITIVDERLPDPKTYPPLPDLILDNIEQIPWAFAVTEKLILLEISVLLIIVLLHRYRSVSFSSSTERKSSPCSSAEWSSSDGSSSLLRHFISCVAWRCSSPLSLWQHNWPIVNRRSVLHVWLHPSLNIFLGFRDDWRSVEESHVDIRWSGHVLVRCENLWWLSVYSGHTCTLVLATHFINECKWLERSQDDERSLLV